MPPWTAKYSTIDGQLSWDVDLQSLACPVSVIAPGSIAMVNKFYDQQLVQKATGGVLYGPDSSQWSCRWYDAVKVIQGEIDRADNARELAKAAYIARQRT